MITRTLTDPSADMFHLEFIQVAGPYFPIAAIDTAWDIMHNGGWAIGTLNSPGTHVHMFWTWTNGTLTVHICKG